MKTEITKLPKSEIELKIEVPAQEWQEFLAQAAKELSKDLKIEGFRPGSAPLKLVEEKIGTARILEEAAEHCIQKCYVRAILENKIEAIGQPEISVLPPTTFREKEIGQADWPKSGVGLIFKAKVAIMPEVKLPDYKKIASEVKRNKVLVEEREVEESISWLQKSRARFSQKSGPCQLGNWVDIKLKINPSDGGENLKINQPEIKDGFILGEGKLIPGLEKKIEGMSAGEEKEFSLSFPKNHYRKDLAGKEANFQIKLESVQNIEPPEINDNFAQGLGNFHDLSALKKNLREGTNLEKEAAESQKVRQEILKKITEKSEIEIPGILLDNVKNQILADLKQNVSQKLGITFEDYLNKVGKTEKELLDSFSTEAEKRAENSLILREILRKEKIEVSDEEVKAETNRILKNEPTALDLDPEKLKYYTEEGLKNEKTLQFLENLSQKP